MLAAVGSDVAVEESLGTTLERPPSPSWVAKDRLPQAGWQPFTEAWVENNLIPFCFESFDEIWNTHTSLTPSTGLAAAAVAAAAAAVGNVDWT